VVNSNLCLEQPALTVCSVLQLLYWFVGDDADDIFNNFSKYDESNNSR